MPIKLSKVLVRRKSSGTILDTVEDAPLTSSFRVLNRQEVEDITSSRQLEPQRKSGRHTPGSPSGGLLDDAQVLSDRSSWRTKDSISTLGSSSTRFSYVSTQPFSAASTSQEDLFPINRPSSVPLPRAHTSQAKHRSTLGFASIGKTFFSRPKTNEWDNDPPVTAGADAESVIPMDRAMTASSYASTVVPSRVPVGAVVRYHDEDADSGDIFDGFTNMHRSTTLEIPTVIPALGRSESDSMLLTGKQCTISDSSPAVPLSHHLDVTPAPDLYRTRSWETDASQKAFLASPSTAFPEDGPVHVEACGEVVMDALCASHYLDQEHGPPPHNPHSYEPSTMSNETHQNKSITPVKPQVEGSGKLSADARFRTQIVREESNPYFSKPSTNFSRQDGQSPAPQQGARKIMTRAEFEQYKRQRAFAQAEDNRSDSSEEAPASEDEDETERSRQLMAQRRKQEANLAVYRQSMMRLTGETSSAPPRPTFNRASQSTPNLLGDSAIHRGKSSDEEEDEDIPLAILHAHGFPSKTRSPTRLSRAGLPEIGREQSSYPAPAGSSRNEVTAGGGGKLPPFAKNIPHDPYVGASLVNLPNRESLAASNVDVREAMAVNHHRPHTRTAFSQMGHQNLQKSMIAGLPPGGLISVIAEEERARAMRRGSPSPNNPLLPQHLMMPQQWPQGMDNMSSTAGPGMRSPHMPLPLPSPASASEQAQVQMNNSMTMMMQLQMQWMQQIMHMQGMPSTFTQQQPTSQLQMQPSFAMPHLPGSTIPPTSTTNGTRQSYGGSTFSVPVLGIDYFSASCDGPLRAPMPSTPSVYGLQMQQQARRSVYTPSLAPSERSTVGQPSRYRPVSMAAASTSAHSTVAEVQRSEPLIAHRRIEYLKPIPSPQGKTKSSIDAATGARNVRSSVMNFRDDEEDHEAWQKMKKQREEIKDKWRQSRQVGAGVKMESTGKENERVDLEGLYQEAA